MIEFRDATAKRLGLDLIVHTNEEGRAQGINPFDHGSSFYTHTMKTEALKQALRKYGFDAAFGGARRDEEKSRAKERIFSFRSANQEWDPKNQRPEFWKLYNGRINKGESIRVFPISNWTELDVWQYIMEEEIPIVPLYFAKQHPMVERDGSLIVVHDERMEKRLGPDEKPEMRTVRFRSLGCYPLTGAVEVECDDAARDRRRDVHRPHLRARRPPDRPRRDRTRWRRRSARGISDVRHPRRCGARDARSLSRPAEADRLPALPHLRQRG